MPAPRHAAGEIATSLALAMTCINAKIAPRAGVLACAATPGRKVPITFIMSTHIGLPWFGPIIGSVAGDTIYTLVGVAGAPHRRRVIIAGLQTGSFGCICRGSQRWDCVPAFRWER